MAGDQHHLVGGTSLELRRGRKAEYLDIPLKDSIKGWRLEWFIVEKHCKSLPPRSGRQPDVRTPSWTESLTSSEITEAKVLLAKIYSLKDGGLTAEAVVADFVFKNIQPVNDRVYPAYLYSDANDSTWVTNRRIPTEDLLSRLDMILRGRVSNAVLLWPILDGTYRRLGHSLSLYPTLLLVTLAWVIECDPLLRILRL
jgi:hypothetical protein